MGIVYPPSQPAYQDGYGNQWGCFSIIGVVTVVICGLILFALFKGCS